jgi:hypothetical protein
MEIQRRSFIRRVLAAGPLSTVLLFETESLFGQADCTLPTPPPATRFTPAEPKVVNRISSADLNAPSRTSQLSQFRGAFGAIQALPSTDVIGWTKQIAQHCLNCAVSDQNNIHFNWQFLTWHRALLYFLERILRKLPGSAGGDDLRLVYWDWENPSSRVLPAIFGPTGQPLYRSNRGNLKGPNWPLTDDDVDVQPSLATPSFSLFGGTAVQQKPVPIAFTGPHASVHNNFDPGDMADLQYSPRDPVFYAHHSNIDRLWSSWVAAGHSNPDFGDAKVYFYDETRTWRYVLMNDLKDETKLGYHYSTLMAPTASVKSFRTFSLSKIGNNNFVAMAAPDFTELNSKPNAPRYLLIQGIQGLEKSSEKATRYGIFTRDVPVGTLATAESGYIGKFSQVLSSGHDHRAPLSAGLTVTGKLAAIMPKAGVALNLYVASLGADRKTSGAGIPLAADNVSIVG